MIRFDQLNEFDLLCARTFGHECSQKIQACKRLGFASGFIKLYFLKIKTKHFKTVRSFPELWSSGGSFLNCLSVSMLSTFRRLFCTTESFTPSLFHTAKVSILSFDHPL